MKDSIIFFGTEEFSLVALQALVENGYPVAAVVTKPDRPQGRGMHLQSPVVKTYALEHGLPVLQPERLADSEAALAAIPNRIGVLSSYGKIIPESTLALFDRGIVNIHPSLLPRYRGPSPIETAIMNGDSQTGVSLMRLVAKMDAGPVYTQTPVEITDSTTASDLYTICAQTGSQLLLQSLAAINSGDLTPVPQDETGATYTGLLNKKDSYVDPQVQTASEIVRHIRAYELYPRTRLKLGDYDLIITRAHEGEPTADDLSVQCADTTWLIIETVIAPSGRSVSGSDFKRGYSVN